jgi:hypothetical protein
MRPWRCRGCGRQTIPLFIGAGGKACICGTVSVECARCGEPSGAVTRRPDGRFECADCVRGVTPRPPATCCVECGDADSTLSAQADGALRCSSCLRFLRQAEQERKDRERCRLAF